MALCGVGPSGSGYLEISSALINAYPISIAGFIKPSGAFQTIAGLFQAAGAGKVEVFSTAAGLMRAAEGANPANATQGAPLGWQFACGVWASGSSRKIYVRLPYGGGLHMVENTNVNTIGTVDTTDIGARHMNSTVNQKVGAPIAEISFWSGALTYGEVSRLADGVPANRLGRDSILKSYVPGSVATGIRDIAPVPNTWTNNGLIVVPDHPAMRDTERKRKIYFLKASGFNPGWAYAATRIVGGAFQ